MHSSYDGTADEAAEGTEMPETFQMHDDDEFWEEHEGEYEDEYYSQSLVDDAALNPAQSSVDHGGEELQRDESRSRAISYYDALLETLRESLISKNIGKIDVENAILDAKIKSALIGKKKANGASFASDSQI